MVITKLGKFNSEAFYERLLSLAKRCQQLVAKLPKTQYNFEYGSQLIRSSSSPGSNYIEALEALGKKDFIHKLRISRKETRCILRRNPALQSKIWMC